MEIRMRNNVLFVPLILFILAVYVFSFLVSPLNPAHADSNRVRDLLSRAQNRQTILPLWSKYPDSPLIYGVINEIGDDFVCVANMGYNDQPVGGTTCLRIDEMSVVSLSDAIDKR
jgi:hypothetical protein